MAYIYLSAANGLTQQGYIKGDIRKVENKEKSQKQKPRNIIIKETKTYE